jgi:transposase
MRPSGLPPVGVPAERVLRSQPTAIHRGTRLSPSAHPNGPRWLRVAAYRDQSRRLREWSEAGVWQRLHEMLPAELRAAGVLDLSRASVDSSHLPAMKGGAATGPSPVDPGKTGSKHHVIVEAHGIPLAATLTGGNRNDVTQLIPLVRAVPPIRGKRGQPLRRPKHLYADRGYDHERYRDQVRRFRITAHIARRGTEHGSRLGVHRWVVEGAVALLHSFHRLRIRWAFITLGCAVIRRRRLGTAL